MILKILFITSLTILFVLSNFSKEKYKKKLHQNSKYRIGVAINPDVYMSNPLYKNIVDEEFNSITSENALKMNRIINVKGEYSWVQPDRFIQAAKKSKRIHGHTLIWHRAIPKWLEEFSGSKKQWDSILESYVTNVVSKYKGKIDSWDVVNEAFENDGTFRKSLWYNNLGESYIEKAFIYAHKADKKAVLFYNDFGQENFPLKNKAIHTLLFKLKNKNIPIHGVGYQLHTHYEQDLSILKDDIEEICKLNLQIHFSEISVRVNIQKSNKFVYNDNEQLKQFNFLASLINLYNQIPKKQQFGITFWNVGDKDSYLLNVIEQNQYPQIYDQNYKRKKYFDVLLNQLKNQ